MSWKIEYLGASRKQLSQLDPQIRAQILRYLREQVMEGDDPYEASKQLTGKWRRHVRFRIDDYRVICKIEDRKLLVAVVKVGHRSDVYD